MRLIKKVSFFVIIFGFAIAFAKSETLPSENPSKSIEEAFIQDNIAITKWIDHMADNLDMFLMGERQTEQKNNTHIRWQNSTYGNDGRGVRNSNTLGIDLHLPNVEEYWLLKFSSYDENKEQRGVQNGYLRQAAPARNYGAGVGYYNKIGEVKVAFQPRVDLQNPLSVSQSLSFENLSDFVTYQINPKLEFFATPDKGAGVYTAFNVNFVLTKVYSLTFINYSEYDEKPMLFTVTNGPSLGQIVDSRSRLDYSLLFNSTNQPNYELSGYSFSIAWSQVIYKRILDYQIIPHLDFLDENHYQGKTGLTLNLNFNF